LESDRLEGSGIFLARIDPDAIRSVDLEGYQGWSGVLTEKHLVLMEGKMLTPVLIHAELITADPDPLGSQKACDEKTVVIAKSGSRLVTTFGDAQNLVHQL